MRTARPLGLLLILLLASTGLAFGQFQATTNNQSIVIENFDDPEASPWIVVAGKFVSDGFPEVAFVETWPEALYRDPPQGETAYRALGARAAFDRQGYNYLEFIPAETNDEGNLAPRAIPIPGRVRNMDVWVWGSNFNYYMDAHLRDYRGMVHVVKLGDLNFRGWRNLRLQIPSFIPQSTRYTAEFIGGEVQNDLRSLELVKLVLWTQPQERVNGFFVYLDEIKVETDIYRDPFDGEDLRDPEFIEQLWSQGQTVGNEEN